MGLTLDPKNANLGTVRGQTLLHESVTRCGYGRPILVDTHGTIIAGNKTYTVAEAEGAPLDLVETHGDELVVVVRDDLDLITDPTARQLAYYDNRVQQLDLSWSSSQVSTDLLAGVPVDAAFFPHELDALTEFPRLPHEPMRPRAPLPVSHMDSPEPPVTPAPYVLTFETPAQQATWQQFLSALAVRFPDLTPAARLSAHLVTAGVP